jgi:lipoprotein-releasing system ATP-binding protein
VTTQLGAIVATHVRKCYDGPGEPREVLKDVTLNLSPGRSLAIMGPSGSGKTTLLNILGTLDQPTSGEVLIQGQDPFALTERVLAGFRNRNIGFIFQAHHLLPQCSVMENVLLPAAVRSARHRTAVRQRAAELLRRVDLAHRMHARPSELSGGECQRAAVVRALINAPKILLADEPTGNLDSEAAEGIAKLLAELQHEAQVALIVVTHSADLARRMDVALTLRDGQLQMHHASGVRPSTQKVP